MDCLSNTLLYKKYVCLKVFAPSKKTILYPSRQDSSKEGCCFPLEKQILFCRMPHYSSWQLLHATDTAVLEEMMVFLRTDMFILKVQFFILQCNRLKETTFLQSCIIS